MPCKLSPNGAIAPWLPRTSTRPQRHASVQDPRRLAVVAQHRLGKGSGVVLEQAPAIAAAAEDRPCAVRQRPDRAPQVFWQAKQPRGAEPHGCAMTDHDRERPGLKAFSDPL